MSNKSLYMSKSVGEKLNPTVYVDVINYTCPNSYTG